MISRTRWIKSEILEVLFIIKVAVASGSKRLLSIESVAIRRHALPTLKNRGNVFVANRQLSKLHIGQVLVTNNIRAMRFRFLRLHALRVSGENVKWNAD
jgi:hypothetical protein